MRINGQKAKIPLVALLLGLSFAPCLKAQSKRDLGSIHARLENLVQQQLMMLPNYSVFDNLEFEIADTGTVVLSGKTTRPSLKSNAESAVLRLEGVSKVVNKIEVLPISPSDDRLRLEVYRAVFSQSRLQRYGMRAVPPIHFIVENGNITLVGIVANQADKDLADIAAKQVAGAFSVTNKLRIEKKH